MTATLHRGPVTDALLTALAAVGKPVGDAAMPAGAGWTNKPNAPGSQFTPYLVLTPMPASRSGGSMGLPQGEWQLPYAISAYGTLRSQCEWMSDQGRATLATLRNTVLDLGPDNYKVQQVWTSLIDRPVPAYTTDGALWAQHDQISVWLSQELT